MDLKEQIIKTLKESEPMKMGDLVEVLKADKKDVEKVIKELKKEEIVTSPKRCYITID